MIIAILPTECPPSKEDIDIYTPMYRSWPPVASQGQPAITSQLQPALLQELPRVEDSDDIGLCHPPIFPPTNSELPPLLQHMPKRQYDRFNTPLPKRGRTDGAISLTIFATADPDFLDDKRARMREAAEKRERINRTVSERPEQFQSPNQQAFTSISIDGDGASTIRCLRRRNRG